MRALTFWMLNLGFWLGLATSPGTVMAVAGPEPVALTRSEPRVNLADAIWLLEDASGALTIEDMRRPEVQAGFRRWDAEHGDVNLSFSRSAWWARVRLQRDAQTGRIWILDVPYAYNKYLDFYAPGMPPVLTGHARPLESRPLFSRHFAFTANVADAPGDYFFRVASNYAVSLPLVAWLPTAYAQNTLQNQLLEALYHGSLLAMVVYALLVWVFTRDRRFGYYALYGTGLNLTMFAGNGWGNVFVWKDWYQFDEVASGVFSSLTTAAFLLFLRGFLRTDRTAPPAVDLTIRAFATLAALHALLMLAAMGREAWISSLFHSLFGLTGMLAIMVSVTLWLTRTHATPGRRYFVASWAAITTGLCVAIARVYDWVPTNGLTSYAVQITSGIEMLLLSFTLAAIVRHERQQRLATQARMIDVLRKQEQTLERAVAQRTQALDAAVQRERKTLSEHLRFAALVSHEFRNSLNVISSQSDMVEKQADAPAVARRTHVIRQHVNRLAKMTETWLKSDQILNADAPPQVQPVACQPWLDALLDRHLDGQDRERVRCIVAPDAGTVWADPRLLEVVVLNLLENAFKYSPASTPITVRMVAGPANTGAGMTGLQVSDQGPGIEPALHGRLFERYFRVDPESAVRGTGLGLSFVRHIAEQHGGSVELESRPGHGSTFTVWFPDRDPG